MKNKRYSFKKIGLNKKEKEPLKPLFEKQALITALSVLLVVVITLTGSLAIFTKTSEGNEYNVVQVGELELSYVDLNEEGNVLQLADSYPISDTTGEKAIPYRFSVENTGTIIAKYTIKIIDDTDTINADGCGDNLIDDTYLRYKFDNQTSQNLKDKKDIINGGYVIHSGTLEANESNIHEIRIWINDNSPNSILGTHYHGKVVIEIEQDNATDPYERPDRIITIGGISKEVFESTPTMSNYSNQGCIANQDFSANTCIEGYVPMNGLYELSDDDGVSYYYKGEVDNLVKFGVYEKNYYVYRYDRYDFVSLDACQFKYPDCSESNKVIKYLAGTPMYWRIVRINGDKSIRMIYSGATPGATGHETGIGLSRYNESHNDIKYSGYTYDRTTTEVASAAKNELDAWYNAHIAPTSYDSKVVTGKFCSDTSGAMDATIALMGGAVKTFASVQRNFPMLLGLNTNATPTFKCPTTSETYGGSYSLKVGLLTMDEMVAAGGQIAYNNSYYLYNGTKGNYDGKYFWTMSPTGFGANYADMGVVHDAGNFNSYDVDYQYGLLRPVINLNPSVTFKPETNGSVLNPYELAE